MNTILRLALGAIYVVYLISVSLVLIKMTHLTHDLEARRIGFIDGIGLLLPRITFLLLTATWLGRLSAAALISAGALTAYYGVWDYAMWRQFDNVILFREFIRPSLWAHFASGALSLAMVVWGAASLFRPTLVTMARQLIATAFQNLSRPGQHLAAGLLAYYSLLPLEGYGFSILWLPSDQATLHLYLRWTLLACSILSIGCTVYIIRSNIAPRPRAILASYLGFLIVFSVLAVTSLGHLVTLTRTDRLVPEFMLFFNFQTLSIAMTFIVWLGLVILVHQRSNSARSLET